MLLGLVVVSSGAPLSLVLLPLVLGAVVSILRFPQVIERVGLKRSRIYKLMALGEFPQSIVLGNAGAVGWLSTEIDAWIVHRVKLSRSGKVRRAPGRRARVGDTASAVPSSEERPTAS